MTMEGGRQGRRTYPYLPDTNWWALRRQFQRTPPRGEVNAAYLSGILNVGERAAQNLVPTLRAIGLIGDDNRITERALAWREDEQYRQVTTEMLEAIYPQGLRDVAPPPEPDRGTVERWFLRDTGTGQAAADRMTRFYLLLAAGDPNAGEQATERPNRQGTAAPQARDARPRATRRGGGAGRGEPAREAAETATPEQVPAHAPRQAQPPSVHIDIQVHIDPAATAEQIDQIFASMARHLYDRQ
jgi:hypothetical protein